MMTAELLSRARAGDGEAFRELTGPHWRELQVHCYRMLGSFADAEDAVQDDALRSGERGRLLVEARRARRARRRRRVPDAPARRRTGTGNLVAGQDATLDAVIQDLAGDEALRADGWAGVATSTSEGG